MAVAIILAYYDMSTINVVKSFIAQAPGASDIKHFTTVINSVQK
jgi:hypothetical protein